VQEFILLGAVLFTDEYVGYNKPGKAGRAPPHPPSSAEVAANHSAMSRFVPGTVLVGVTGRRPSSWSRRLTGRNRVQSQVRYARRYCVPFPLAVSGYEIRCNIRY
jgi:hypothetical protein